MAINIGGAQIEGGTSTFRLKNTSNTTIFERSLSSYNNNTFAKVVSATTPMFQSSAPSPASWVQLTTSGWTKVISYLTNTSFNVGSHYSTTNTRFTCPITGPYLFIHTAYVYTADYIHPQFSVNGGVGTRRYTTPYRIRGYGMVANYQMDGQIEEVIYCTAGDYVEVYMYASGASYYFPVYSMFMGAYVG